MTKDGLVIDQLVSDAASKQVLQKAVDECIDTCFSRNLDKKVNVNSAQRAYVVGYAIWVHVKLRLGHRWEPVVLMRTPLLPEISFVRSLAERQLIPITAGIWY